MPCSYRLLDNAFRSELERLSELTRKSLQGRRRTEKRRTRRRAAGSASQENLAAPTPENAGMTLFFRHLIQTPDRRALLLIVDASETMERPSRLTGVRKYDQACKLTAALSIVLRTRYDVVQVIAIGHSRGSRSPIMRSDSASTEPILGYLRRLRPGGKSRFIHVLQRYVKRLPMTADCIIVSDMLAAEWEPGLAILASTDRLRTSLIHICDSDEDLLLSQFGLVQESGMTGRPLDIDMSRQLRSGVMRGDALDSAGAADEDSHDYLRVTTDQPFEHSLLRALEGK